MLKLRNTRRAIALAAGALALAAGTTIGTAGAAFADSGSDTFAMGGCSGGDNYNTNQMTGWVKSTNGDQCQALIEQNGGSDKYSYFTWSGVVYTPTYWRGWASNGTYLTDQVCIADFTTGPDFWWCGPVR